MKVRISRSLLAELQAKAAEESHEICGLLTGTPERIAGAIPAANVADDPACHFEIDPAVLIAAHRAARGGGPAIAGHYHSHPSGLAEPSRTDADAARGDGALWLVIGADAVRLWRAAGRGRWDMFEEAAIEPE
jgi:proteasome lid subunit RPN8/RPN11